MLQVAGAQAYGAIALCVVYSTDGPQNGVARSFASQALKTLTGSSSAASNHQLVRAGTQSKSTQRTSAEAC